MPAGWERGIPMSSQIRIDREAAKAAMHPALHDLGVTIPGVPGDCHCNLISEVVLKAIEEAASGPTCPDCGQPVAVADGVRDSRHDHCGPLPHTGPVGGPYCERCR
jgi:hypothetical protein